MTRHPTAVLLLVITLSIACRRVPDPLPGFPKLVLWAWERPENLSYILPATTGVAYLADTITLQSNGLARRPRAQPLRVPDQTPLIAVIRIESHPPTSAALSDVTGEILLVTRGRPIRAIQIDYDARASERPYYRQLLTSLRQQLPPSMPLEITALVSWCQSDDWIRRLPVSDAVPMFFRMGPDPHSTQERIQVPLCESSIGIATDNFYVPVPHGKRVFVFAPQPWNELAYRAVLQASKGWQ